MSKFVDARIVFLYFSLVSIACSIRQRVRLANAQKQTAFTLGEQNAVGCTNNDIDNIRWGVLLIEETFAFVR